MPALLAPLWLAGLAALAVPVLLHLWSRRAGRVVRVGSVRHLGAAPARSRSIRLDDPWLLLLRLGVLALLVLALARPVWRLPAGAPRRLVLVDPALLTPAALADPVLDSLRRGGTEVHTLAPGFPPLALDSAGSESPATAAAASPDVWSLLRAADSALPAGSEILVVAPARAALLQGGRPALRSRVRWHAPGTRRWWIERAEQRGDVTHVLVGAHDGTATWFTPVALGPDSAASPAGLPAVVLREGQAVLLDRGRPLDHAPVREAPPPRVLIAAQADRAGDARFLAAAAGALLGDDARIEIRDTAATADSAAWIAWLADAPVPERMLRRARGGAVLLSDHGAGLPVEGRLLAPGTVQSLHRRAALDAPGANDPAEAAALWTDGWGAPLLVAERVGRGRHLRFLSRFLPEWTGLVLDPAFPALAGHLGLPDPLPDDAALRAAAPVAASQRLPLHRPGTGSGAAVDLAFPVWLAALLLFAAERWLATRPRTG